MRGLPRAAIGRAAVSGGMLSSLYLGVLEAHRRLGEQGRRDAVLLLDYDCAGRSLYWGVEGAAECEANGVPFGQQTKWTYGNSVYFMFIALTTIGFGDFYPTTTGSKVFFIFHSAVGVAVIAASLGYFSASVVARLEADKDAVRKRWARMGCSVGVTKFYIKYRVWVYVATTYVLLLLLGGVLFGFGNPFNPSKYLNGVYFTVRKATGTC